jgi:hypothetical protein
MTWLILSHIKTGVMSNRKNISYFGNFLQSGATLGFSILTSRNSLDHNECYEWATYHLFGGPTYVMIRSEASASST